MPEIAERIKAIPPVVWIGGGVVLLVVFFMNKGSGAPTAGGVVSGGGGGGTTDTTGGQPVVDPETLIGLLQQQVSDEQQYIIDILQGQAAGTLPIPPGSPAGFPPGGGIYGPGGVFIPRPSTPGSGPPTTTPPPTGGGTSPTSVLAKIVGKTNIYNSKGKVIKSVSSGSYTISTHPRNIGGQSFFAILKNGKSTGQYVRKGSKGYKI